MLRKVIVELVEDRGSLPYMLTWQSFGPGEELPSLQYIGTYAEAMARCNYLKSLHHNPSLLLNITPQGRQGEARGEVIEAKCLPIQRVFQVIPDDYEDGKYTTEFMTITLPIEKLSLIEDMFKQETERGQAGYNALERIVEEVAEVTFPKDRLIEVTLQIEDTILREEG